MFIKIDQLLLLLTIILLAFVFRSLAKRSRLKKIEKRVSDKEYVSEFLLMYPEILPEQVIEVRNEVASDFGIPPDVISMEMRLADLKKIEFDFGLALGDIWDDIYDGLKGTDLESKAGQSPQIEMVYELFYLYIKARAKTKC